MDKEKLGNRNFDGSGNSLLRGAFVFYSQQKSELRFENIHWLFFLLSTVFGQCKIFADVVGTLEITTADEQQSFTAEPGTFGTLKCSLGNAF